METNIYQQLVELAKKCFGAGALLESGNGIRFTSARKGKLTIYHGEVEPGNAVEVAFEPTSVARRFGLTEREFRSLLADIRSRTGRSVGADPKYNWPRVGIATESHLELVVERLFKPLLS